MRKPASEFEAFSLLVSSVLSTPKAEILRRETEYQEQSALMPNRRGRGRKKTAKPSASPDPAAT